jgi:hypothetical protein
MAELVDVGGLNPERLFEGGRRCAHDPKKRKKEGGSKSRERRCGGARSGYFLREGKLRAVRAPTSAPYALLIQGLDVMGQVPLTHPMYA